MESYQTYLIPLATIPGPITDAVVSDFREDAVHPLLGGRHSRNFLHFSYIALATGDAEKAAQFAEAAIAICPPRATALLPLLQAALRDARSEN